MQEEQRVRHLITFYLIPFVTLKAKAATELKGFTRFYSEEIQ